MDTYRGHMRTCTHTKEVINGYKGELTTNCGMLLKPGTRNGERGMGNHPKFNPNPNRNHNPNPNCNPNSNPNPN